MYDQFQPCRELRRLPPAVRAWCGMAQHPPRKTLPVEEWWISRTTTTTPAPLAPFPTATAAPAPLAPQIHRTFSRSSMLSFRSITDRALDVDPDLRFMALEDLKKCLAPSNASHIEAFVPTLFKLLNDPNPNVQSLALRVFPAIVPCVSTATTMAVIDQLYHDEGPVAGLVLRLMLACKYDVALAAALVANLVPPVLARDQVDLLVELVRHFVAVFSPQQMVLVALFLVRRSFQLPASSKYRYGFDMLVARGVEFAPYMAMVDAEPAVDFSSQLVRARLVLSLVRACHEPADLHRVYRDAVVVLARHSDDLDYDQLQEDHTLKDVCFDVVDALAVRRRENPTTATVDSAADPQISDIVSTYLHYSTTEFELASDDDDILFSDDDADDQETYDDGAWKLRYKAIRLTAQLNLGDFLPTLVDSLADRNSLISTAAIDAIVAIGPSQDLVGSIEDKILSNLSNETLTSYLALIDSILAHNLQFHRQFLAKLFEFLNLPKNLDLNENLSLIASVSNYENASVVAEISTPLVEPLCDKILHKSGNEVFTILKIFDCWSTKLTSNDIFNCLITRLGDAKVLIDFRNEMVRSLTVYVVHHELLEDQWLQVYTIFEENLTSESCLKQNLVSLNEILAKESLKVELFMPLVHTLKAFVSEANQYSHLILSLANKLEESIEIDKLVLFGKYHCKDGKMVNLVVQNLQYHDIHDYTSVLDLLNAVDVDEGVNWHGIIAKLPEFSILEQKLDLSRPTNVKILAITCLERGLDSQIRASETHLNSMITNQQFGPDFVHTLQFLSYVNVQKEVTVDMGELVLLLSKDVPDTLKVEISKNLGFLMKNSSLLLVQKYVESDDVSIKMNLLNAIKTFITNFHDEGFETTVYKLLLDQVNVVGIMKEFKAVGEILAIISYKNNDYGEVKSLMNLQDQSTGLVYTSLVILNHLVVKLDDKALIDQLIHDSLKYYEITNIDIKVMLTKNLINVYYHFPEIITQSIISTVLTELKAYPEFRKVIPMGPYKYVIDEGLEIRKLVFEWLYLVINDDAISKDFDAIMDVVITQGLLDKELDIVNLSYKSMNRLVKKNPEYLKDVGRMNGLIDQLRKNRDKKVKSKASNQEIEEFNESKKSLEGFVRTVEEIRGRMSFRSSDWEAFKTEGGRLGQ